MSWHDYILRDPWWLAALLVIPLIIWLRSRRGVPALVVPFAAAWYRPSMFTPSRLPMSLGMVGLALLVVALARPQHVDDRRSVRRQGYDLILAMDMSGSMLAEDYAQPGEGPDRFDVIKRVVRSFIRERPNDRIGIVVFATHAYTLAPLTFDHAWLERQLDRLKIGTIDPSHTAIGDGLGVALTRLEQARREVAGRRKGAFIVLLTDGSNNSGVLTPLQAAAIARARGIPVYTIGAGKDGYSYLPVRDAEGHVVTYERILSDLDENTLNTIAEETGGQFYRARDANSTKEAFQSIDRAQKIDFSPKPFLVTSELFPWFAVPGLLAFLSAGALLAWPTLRRRRTPADPTSLAHVPPPA